MSLGSSIFFIYIMYIIFLLDGVFSTDQVAKLGDSKQKQAEAYITILFHKHANAPPQLDFLWSNMNCMKKTE